MNDSFSTWTSIRDWSYFHRDVFSQSVERMGWVLMHSLWLFTVIALLAWMVQALLRRAPSSVRYGTLLSLLLLMVAAPVVTFVLLPNPSAETFVNVSPGGTHERVAAAVESPPPGWLSSPEQPPLIDGAQASDAALVAGSRPESKLSPDRSAWWERLNRALEPWLSTVVGVWCFGVYLFSVRPLWSNCVVRRLRTTGVTPVPESVRLTFERVCLRLNISQRVRVLQSTLVRAPIVVGCFRSVILLPASFLSGAPVSQLEAILAHELAHVRRYDYLVNLLQTLVETLFFYHPAVWWLSHRMRIERENCCDDLVVAALDNRVEYGRALLVIAELRGAAASSLALSARDGSLHARVRRLFADAARDDRCSSAGLAALAVIASALLVAALWTATLSQANDTTSAVEFGTASHGLRARIVSLRPGVNDDSPDLDAFESDFERSEDMTFGIELKNVSDKPIFLAGVRFGEGYQEETRGQLRTEFYAPHWFEFEFTDDSGQLLTRPQREFWKSWMLATSASVHQLEPGQSLITVLRPAKWRSPMDYNLPPGEYHVRVRYRGPDDEFRAEVRKHWPEKPILDAWPHSVVSNSVPISIAESSRRTRAENLVWGEPVDGLQAALEFRVPDDVTGDPLTAPGVPPGASIQSVFHVRNVGDKPITLISESGRQGDQIHVTDEQGGEVNVKDVFFSGWPIDILWTLQPGEVAELPVLTPSLESLDQPGRYTVRYTIRFNSRIQKDVEGNIIFPRPGDYDKVLDTGDTPLFRTHQTADATDPPESTVSTTDAARPTAVIQLVDDNWLIRAGDLDVADVSDENDPVVLLALLDKGPRASQFLMTGGGIFWKSGAAPQAAHVEMWNQRFAVDEALDPRVRRLIQLGDAAIDRVHEQLMTARPAVAGHLAMVLRSIGNAESVPLLIQLLERRGRSDESIVMESHELMATLAATSALWELTGRKHTFSPQQWSDWFDGVSDDFAVARDRGPTANMSRAVDDRIQSLIADLRMQEQPARDRLIVQGAVAVPLVQRALRTELQSTQFKPLPTTDSPRPISQRLSWVLDELGATDQLPAVLRREYFVLRFAEAGRQHSLDPVDAQAVCRAISHCSFADFCGILLDVERLSTPVQNSSQTALESWLNRNKILFSRRFQTHPAFISGDPSYHSHWDDVVPADNPAEEIVGAVPVLVAALTDSEPDVRASAARLAGVIGFCSNERPEELIVALRDAWLAERGDTTRYGIGLAMARFSTPVVLKALSDGLKSDRPEIVSDAAGLFDWVNVSLNNETRGDFERLKTLTYSDDDQLRARAVRSLASKAPELLISELPRLVRDDVDDIRMYLTRLRLREPPPEFADMLFVLVNDSKEQIRTEAISAIGRTGGPGVMPRLVPLLRDLQVHGWAASALVQCGGQDALPLLMEELGSGNDVGGMIYQHLKRLTGESFEHEPQPWINWWKQNEAFDRSGG